ncbi:MAG: RNA polymerase sigma-70 factor [Prolixibacteraceae bacterium]|nr:RNA polymerase sigma-70 factor [Prolixibacteraceae bacterium]
MNPSDSKILKAISLNLQALIAEKSFKKFIFGTMKAEEHIGLFHAVSKGDEKAFEKLYKLYFPRLYTFVLKITSDGSLAKDMVQNVFIRLWETHETFRYEHPEAFLYKMVRNASLNYIRHLKVVDNLKSEIKDQYLGEELYYIDMVGNEPYLLIEKELSEKVMEVMDELPEKCRVVFRMSRIEGLKNQEIADRLGLSIKTVEKHISKALEVYRKKFAGYLPMSVIILVLQGLK